jgi:hypothetical protein
VSGWTHADEFKQLEQLASLVLQTSLIGIVAAGTLAASTDNSGLQDLLTALATALGLPLGFAALSFMQESDVLLAARSDTEESRRLLDLHLRSKRIRVRIALYSLILVIWGTFVFSGAT